ncbi:MAG: hypothetical protein H0U76_28365, partial [Ktedonobacteraceae bacterium]|nr:hypothetical protein [Ktedonobacteraceae bacterium]
MSNRETYISRDYAEAIFQRVIRPMPPYNFEPDWDDQPSRFKIYSDAERIALPTNFPARLAPMADVLHRIGTPQPEGRSLSYEELSTMLQFAHGAHSRRLRITWNHDARALSVYPVSHFAYARGTASGGGMYPTEIYWGCGASGALLPGLYHYNN